MSTREIHNYELGDEASLDFVSNWEDNADTGAELASQSTPVIPVNQQQHIQTNQPVHAVQHQHQNSIATTTSIPRNVNYLPWGYATALAISLWHTAIWGYGILGSAVASLF